MTHTPLPQPLAMLKENEAILQSRSDMVKKEVKGTIESRLRVVSEPKVIAVNP